MLKKQKILNTTVNVASTSIVLELINDWASNANASKYICLFNVHMCMEAYDNDNFSDILNQSDLVLADGFPIYLAQKLLGHSDASQIRGADLTMELTKISKKNNIPIGFLGGSKETLEKMCDVLINRDDVGTIKYSYSPPFRSLNNQEKNDIIDKINDSGIKILFVGLGCPKQEIWMKEHKEKLNCIMVGVGAAFDFIAGNKKTAPIWMQRIGLEWLYRLLSEPKRLWKRYFKHNPRFIYYFILQYFGIIRR